MKWLGKARVKKHIDASSFIAGLLVLGALVTAMSWRFTASLRRESVSANAA